jgi:hypothetical protein
MNNKDYDNITIMVSKGMAQEVKDYAAMFGETVNSFIIKSINERLKQESLTKAHKQYQKTEKFKISYETNCYGSRDWIVMENKPNRTQGKILDCWCIVYRNKDKEKAQQVFLNLCNKIRI